MTRIETRSSIRTKYLGPTNYRGARVSVTEAGFLDEPPRRLIAPWNHQLGVEANHAAAAQAWLDKYLASFSEKYNQKAVVNGPGLCFDACYYWSWTFEEGRKEQ